MTRLEASLEIAVERDCEGGWCLRATWFPATTFSTWYEGYQAVMNARPR